MCKCENNFMKTIEGFKLRKLGNEYILVGESMALINFNKMITLNETAAFLWEKAEEMTREKGTFPRSARRFARSTKCRPRKP